jgi:hypothetical protein
MLKKGSMRLFLAGFFIINLFLSSFYIDVWVNANTTSRALPIITYFESGTFRIDKYHKKTCDKAFINGHYYTDKAPLPTYFVLPFFGLLKSIGVIKPDEDGNLFGKPVYILGSILTAIIPLTILIMVVFLKIRNQKLSVSPVLLSMLPFYASFIFLFSGTYFAHILSGIFLIGSYIYLKRGNHLLSGVFAGLSFLCEFNLAVIFLVWGVQLIIKYRKISPLIFFSAGVLPSVIFILIYNYVFSGSPFTMLYRFHNFEEIHSNYGFLFPSFKSLWGLSLSWYKGLLFYSPFLIMVLVYFVRTISFKDWHSLLTHPLLLSSVVYFFFISSYFGWWGGWTQGPRLLLALAMLLTYEGILFISKREYSKSFFWIVIALGLLITLLSKITVAYSVPTNVANPMMDLVLPELLYGKFNENNILTMLFNIRPVIAAVIFLILSTVAIFGLNRWHKSLSWN